MQTSQCSETPVAEPPSTAPKAPYSVTTEEFRVLSGLNERKTRELIAERKVDSFKLGKRRIIIWASYLALVERLRAEQADK
jgi:hypothetical protein